MAGSINPSARIDSTIVFRQKAGKVIATRIDLKKMLIPLNVKPDKKESDNADSSEASSPQLAVQNSQNMFYLYPDDIVFIPRRRINKIAQVAEELSSVLFFRGWGFNFGYDWNTDLDE
jgi:hypothetical protein